MTQSLQGRGREGGREGRRAHSFPFFSNPVWHLKFCSLLPLHPVLPLSLTLGKITTKEGREGGKKGPKEGPKEDALTQSGT